MRIIVALEPPGALVQLHVFAALDLCGRSRSDIVVMQCAPSLDHSRGKGWAFPSDVRVLCDHYFSSTHIIQDKKET